MVFPSPSFSSLKLRSIKLSVAALVVYFLIWRFDCRLSELIVEDELLKLEVILGGGLVC